MFVLPLAVWLAACTTESPSPEVPPAVEGTEVMGPDPLGRDALNQALVAENVPAWWIRDDGDGILEPNELVTRFDHSGKVPPVWVKDGAFTDAWKAAWGAAVVRSAHPSHPDDEVEKRRQEAVATELSQGRPVLLWTDTSGFTAAETKALESLAQAAVAIERLHALQTGAATVVGDIPVDHPPSAALFARNQGPECVAPLTVGNPDCSALPSRKKPASGLYPEVLQADPKFCEALAEDLKSPFTVVRAEAGGKLVAVPYSEAWAAESGAVAGHLDAAAAAFGAEEPAFVAYLKAAAQAFRDNDWVKADEAWAEMSVDNSKWYARVAADETYFEPCNRKAGYHLGLARVDQKGLAWRDRLLPHQQAMEEELARLAGPPYAVRQVGFDLPEFIEVVLNAGDSRAALGATIGQSLPNWGPVAEKGGRTVAMTNIATDPDSRAALKRQADAMFCPATAAKIPGDPKHLVFSTLLHEAAHNLGPSHDYAVNGQTDGALFGGPMAALLEELKAQSAALYLSDFLVARGAVTEDEAANAHLADLVWALGKVADGMEEGEGRWATYPQLAAIQLGVFMEGGSLTWMPDQKAANGTDTGCLELDEPKLKADILKLTTEVLRIKSSGDAAAAKALREKHVVQIIGGLSLHTIIEDRFRREPDNSYLYGWGADH